MKFLLVGDGEWRGRFEQRARVLGLSQHFVFAGLVSPNEVPLYAGIMDGLVHLSGAKACPRVATGIGCGPSGGGLRLRRRAGSLPRNETVFCSPRATCSDLPNGSCNWPAIRRCANASVAAARNWVKLWFPVERMVEQLHALYLKLSARHGIPPYP